MSFPRWREAGDLIRVEEFREDGTLVIRADLPGIDPDKDVELTVSDGMLHIGAERREEEKREEKGYLRHEVRYGSLSRSLPLPEGVTEDDITATYEAGVLEIRVPEPKRGTGQEDSDQQGLTSAEGRAVASRSVLRPPVGVHRKGGWVSWRTVPTFAAGVLAVTRRPACVPGGGAHVPVRLR
jgi:HSP20 family protein